MKICLECEGITETQLDRCASCDAPLTDTSAVHFPLRRGEADAGNPLIGRVIDGKYQVQGVLGKGGMGTVFRAIHQVSLIPVALKILNPRFSVRGEYRDYFLAEAQKAGRVTHEHAGRILDVGEAEDGTVYIAMEEVNGITLDECIHGDERLPPAIVVDILEQICQALAAAHHAGLVHRDLSPRNVMVVVRKGKPFIKILDFGIAKGLPQAASDGDDDVPLAPAGFASPPYSAPEHLEGQDVDARADLYSLGVIAFEALTQQLPVAGSTAQERALATRRGEVEPLPQVPGVPTRFTKLIRALMAQDPDARPASAEEVLRELHGIRLPGSRFVRDMAVLLFVLAVVVLALAYAKVQEPVLAQRFGVLKVATSADEATEVSHLRSEQLAVLRFDYGGFRASDLVAEVARDGARLSIHPLGGQEVDGVLVLDREASSDYASFLAVLERLCRGGAVTVTFQLEGGAALGIANVLVDDTKPVLQVEAGDASGVLSEASTIRVQCDDTGGLAKVTFAARRGDEVLVTPRVISRDDLVGRIKAAVLLREIQTTAMPETGVSLTFTAEDLAGNVSKLTLGKSFEVDFRVPEISGPEEVAATRIGGKAFLALALREPDAGLGVWLQSVIEGVEGWKPLVATGSEQIQIELPEFEQKALNLTFQLRDRAGNRREFSRRVTFYDLDPELRLEGGPSVVRSLQAFGSGLLWTGEKVEFGFLCNDLYKPTSVRVRDRAVRARLMTGGRGRGRILLEGVRDVDRRVQVVLTLEPDTLNPMPTEVSWDVWVQCSPMRLALPDTGAMRFFSELVSDNGLFDESNGTLDQNTDWQITPSDARLLRGRIAWTQGDDAVVSSVDLPLRMSPDAKFFREQSARRGTNVLYLDLRDLFGRRVRVSLGEAPAPVVKTGPLAGAARITEFQFQRIVAGVQVDTPKLEYQQKTRIIFHSGYSFVPEDREHVSLLFQAIPVPCVGILAQDEGTDLLFDLSFRDMARAAGLRPEDDRLKRANHEFSIQVVLRTPAGARRFEGATSIKVVTTRSSLVKVRLGDRNAKLAKALGAIQMVPVLRPFGEFKDRVTRVQRRHPKFLRKREIAVQNLRDVFLQQRELTRAQYWAIVQAFVALPREQMPEASAICFAGDPDRAGRLTESGMVPRTMQRDPAGWRRLVAQDGASAVTGLDFHQAFAVARMAGQVVFGDPDCFRLPFAVELELAALGTAAPGVLNGVAGTKLIDLRTADRVKTPLGEFFGLDFGVREWVMDLPWPVSDTEGFQKQIVAGWLADHAEHTTRATSFAELGPALLSPALRAEFSRMGVVRGVTLGEPAELKDVATGRLAQESSPLTAGVPGVVRAIHVNRDGLGLLHDRPHKRLPSIGLRLAGDVTFLRKVRSR